jgi:alpha-L-fucosidase 2
VQTQYLKGGKLITTDYFASAPDSVIVVRMTAKTADGINAIVAFNSQLPHSVSADGCELTADGYVAYHSYPNYNKAKHYYDPNRGTRFRTLVRIITPNEGQVKAFPSGELRICGASEALILIANATSFNGFDKDPVKEGADYKNIVARRMKLASTKTYESLREAHIADYKRLFDRVELNLGKTDSQTASLPTDIQLKKYTDENLPNPELEALYFQYGRYLLISCSRTSGVPANLQGLWNEKLLPPWSCNYTTNINMEENYWFAVSAAQ